MGNFLIPANTKKSMLIFGYFKLFDLLLFLGGIGITLLSFVIFQPSDTFFVVLILMPAMITGFLVMPVPNYYNMRTLISSIVSFYTNQRKFKWKGWCFLDDEDKKIH